MMFRWVIKTARNTKAFHIYTVTIKISMTEYKHLLNCMSKIYSNTKVSTTRSIENEYGEMVTCLFSLFF